MKHKLMLSLAIAVSLTIAFSCSKEDTKVPEELVISASTLEFAPEGSIKTFSVKSNYAWTITSSNWITLSTSGEAANDVAVTIAATAGKNSGTDARTGVITVVLSSGTTKEIAVSQEPYKAPAGIYSASDFTDLAAALAAEEPNLSEWISEDGDIKLYNDVDVSSLTCFPMEAFPSGAILEGQNHTITMSLSSNASKVGLFKTFKGTAKNLTLNGSISVTGEPAAEVHIGPLAADAQGAAIQNCFNYTSITIDLANTSSLCAIAGGFFGKATQGLTVDKCTNNAAITFTSVSAAKGAYYMIGGIIGAYGSKEDTGVLDIENSQNVGDFTCNGGDLGSWNYVGGLVGNTQNSVLTGTTYSIILNNCSSSGDISVSGAAKTRAGGISGRMLACNHISNCSYSGTISLSVSSLERNVGGISSFQEKTCQGLIEGCTFSGKITSAQGHTGKYYIGGILSSGCAATTVIQNCKTTKTSYISNFLLGNMSMIIAQANNACSVKSCKVAGTLNNCGTETILSAANYEDWMCKGIGDGMLAVCTDCGYNAE